MSEEHEVLEARIELMLGTLVHVWRGEGQSVKELEEPTDCHGFKLMHSQQCLP